MMSGSSPYPQLLNVVGQDDPTKDLRTMPPTKELRTIQHQTLSSQDVMDTTLR